MKRSLFITAVALVLCAATAVAAGQERTITDPAEYNAYINAVQMPDLQIRISALEDFLEKYPESVVREDAAVQLMAAYQQAGNATQTLATASRLLQINPSNLRALALLAYSHREAAEAGQNPQQNLAQGRQLAERGLQAVEAWKPAAGLSAEEAEQFRQQVSVIFHAVIGMAALQQQDYMGAQKHLQQAVDGSPDDLRNVYPLALSYLQSQPSNDVMGLWYIARAVNLAAGTPAQGQIANFGRARYVSYHGSEEGWNDVVAKARAQKSPPPAFTIERDSPAKRAARLAASQPVKEMSLAEWSYILTHGDEELTGKVWKQIQSLPAVAFRTRVIEAERSRLLLAGTAESIEERRGDVEVTMSAPIPANLMPKPGVEIDVQGKPAGFDRSPFVLKLENGMLIKR
jgi:tetratricopeptide (TPR) repeat protein